MEYWGWGCSSIRWLEHRTGTSPAQVRFPVAARDFSLRVNFQCRLSYGVRTPPRAIACIYICAHVKDPVTRVRVRWIMETLIHPESIVGWVARLCRNWLTLGKATRISHGSNPKWDNTAVKKKYSRYLYFSCRQYSTEPVIKLFMIRRSVHLFLDTEHVEEPER